MENENKNSEQVTSGGVIIDNAKVMTQEQQEIIKKIHGNKGKKKNFTPEALQNKKDKMKAAWARKKANTIKND